MKGKILFLLLALAGAALDLATKSAVFGALDYPRTQKSVPVIPGFFDLQCVENQGGMFGIGARYGWLLKWLRAGAIVVILVFLFRFRGRPLFGVALALIFAGALGNLYDSFFNDGRVRDFLRFYYQEWTWPNFNLADSFICVGSGLLVLQMLTEKRTRRRAEGARPPLLRSEGPAGAVDPRGGQRLLGE